MAKQNYSPCRDPQTGLTPIEAQVLALYDGGATPRSHLAEAIGCVQETISNILRRPHIIEALQNRSVTEGLAPLIASRKELQIYWTETLRDESRPDKERLKASEYLAKSYGLFLERTETKQDTTITVVTGVPRSPDGPEVMDYSDL